MRPRTPSRTRLATRIALSVCALGVLAAPLSAAPDPVAARIAGFKALGAAFKKLNDTLRSGSPDQAVVQAAVRDIAAARKGIYGWFPAGSGPKPGVKTAAKPEIWSKAADFKAAEDGFARQADALQRAAAGGNADAIGAEARKLGGTCKSCHDAFRVPKD